MWSYLTYLIDPYNPEGLCSYFLLRPDDSFFELAPEEVRSLDCPIVSYNRSSIIAAQRTRGLSIPTELIDICIAARLIHGQPRTNKHESQPWAFLPLLARYSSANNALLKGLAMQHFHPSKLNSAEMREQMRSTCMHLQRAWQNLCVELRRCGEFERFFEVEVPVDRYLLKRELEGLRVDEVKIRLCLDEADLRLNQSRYKLRTKWHILDPFDKEASLALFVREALIGSKESWLLEDYDTLLEVLAEQSELARLFKTCRDARKEKAVLLRLGAIGEDRVYPIFECIGTVTGRILATTPSLQNLPKTSRKVIIPDTGYEFLYPDYSQFEPGILADHSQDMQLIADYNSGDIYSQLSEAVFGSKEFRKAAKTIFLAFCYGMSRDRLSQLASKVRGSSFEKSQESLDRFFSRYETLDAWAEMLRTDLRLTGRIGTCLGNYRYRASTRPLLTSAEQRWVLSQRVQGTASLILKRALLAVCSSSEDIQMLLPMHDAVLWQVPSSAIVEKRKIIEASFHDAFRSLCPSVEPRVVFGEFARTE